MTYIFLTTFTEDDSPKGIETTDHPKYKLTDGDTQGFTILMHAIANYNIALVTHLVKLMDKNSLNMKNYYSVTIFQAAYIYNRDFLWMLSMLCSIFIITFFMLYGDHGYDS